MSDNALAVILPILFILSVVAVFLFLVAVAGHERSQRPPSWCQHWQRVARVTLQSDSSSFVANDNVNPNGSALMAKEEAAEILSIDGHDVRITNPDKPYFSRDVKLSKLDIVRYYLSVASGAV